MHLTAITPILNVSDIDASMKWFESLGWSRCWTYNDAGHMKNAAGSNASGPANFGAVGCGECEIFLCRGAQGSRGTPPIPGRHAHTPPGEPPDDNTPGVWVYWWLKSAAEVDAAHERALKAGIVVICPPTDEPWGCRECRIAHPDGHTFRVSAPVRR